MMSAELLELVMGPELLTLLTAESKSVLVAPKALREDTVQYRTD